MPKARFHANSPGIKHAGSRRECLNQAHSQADFRASTGTDVRKGLRFSTCLFPRNKRTHAFRACFFFYCLLSGSLLSTPQAFLSNLLLTKPTPPVLNNSQTKIRIVRPKDVPIFQAQRKPCPCRSSNFAWGGKVISSSATLDAKSPNPQC